MNSGIYVIRNLVNDKKYVGSSKNFKKREKIHLCRLKNNNHFNIHLSRAVLKYGFENFVFEIIENFIGTKQELVDRENYYIDFHKTLDINFGYNMTYATVGGGDKVSNHPNKDEIGKKISKTLKILYKNGTIVKKGLCGEANGMYGKKRPQWILDKLQEGSRIWRENNPDWRKGFTQTDEAKKRISKAAMGNTRWLGKNHTEESKLKMSISQKIVMQKKRDANGGVIVGPTISREHIIKSKNTRGIPMVIVNGVEYVSCREASELTGIYISKHTLSSLSVKHIHIHRANQTKRKVLNADGKWEVIIENIEYETKI